MRLIVARSLVRAMSAMTVEDNLQDGLQGGLQDALQVGVQVGDLIVREQKALRRITLNRPKALNALTLDMAVKMTALLRSWAADPAVGAVLLDGAGERGLCAGGDIRALYDAAKSGDTLPEKFWATEYHLNVLIARYPKPFIAVMDGLVMGGGVGLSTHAAHRIVTERSAVAMPEVGIGFFPMSAPRTCWRERRCRRRKSSLRGTRWPEPAFPPHLPPAALCFHGYSRFTVTFSTAFLRFQ